MPAGPQRLLRVYDKLEHLFDHQTTLSRKSTAGRAVTVGDWSSEETLSDLLPKFQADKDVDGYLQEKRIYSHGETPLIQGFSAISTDAVWKKASVFCNRSKYIWFGLPVYYIVL